MIDLLPRLRALILRLSCPLFFRKIGKNCTFFGRTRLPMPFRNVMIGDGCMIGDSVMFQTGRKSEIFIGDNCSINSGCHLVANELIRLGNNVAVAEYVSIRDQEHRFSPETGVRGQGYKIEPVTISDNVWICRGVYIGPGTTIGRGCIVGANSVVTGSFPDGVLIAGAPAQIKRNIS